jgi:hypothetical protein
LPDFAAPNFPIEHCAFLMVACESRQLKATVAVVSCVLLRRFLDTLTLILREVITDISSACHGEGEIRRLEPKPKVELRTAARASWSVSMEVKRWPDIARLSSAVTPGQVSQP